MLPVRHQTGAIGQVCRDKPGGSHPGEGPEIAGEVGLVGKSVLERGVSQIAGTAFQVGRHPGETRQPKVGAWRQADMGPEHPVKMLSAHAEPIRHGRDTRGSVARKRRQGNLQPSVVFAVAQKTTGQPVLQQRQS